MPVEKRFMNSKLKTLCFVSKAVLSISLLLSGLMALAQAPSRYLGTITAIGGNTLTVKTDTGEAHQVSVPDSAVLKRIAPGQKDLSTADTIQFSDLATGDRVLVKVDPDAPGPTAQALQIIAIKQADVALKQQKDREDWQRRGVGGLVKSVDSTAGVVTLTSGVGAAAKTITVHVSKKTLLKRYAPASIRFDAALPAPIDAIHAGDQLRARGTKNADGTEIDAEEVVSGTFRNLSGVVNTLDAAASTLTLKDLATKKQVTIHITAEAQLRRLPEMMARMMAARLKGASSGAAGGSAAAANGGGYAQRGGGQGGDPQQMLNRFPPMQLADVKKGDAVMVVSTDGTTDVTAITLLAGVEPLLEAPAASQNMLNNWSLGSGAPDAAAQ